MIDGDHPADNISVSRDGREYTVSGNLSYLRIIVNYKLVMKIMRTITHDSSIQRRSGSNGVFVELRLSTSLSWQLMIDFIKELQLDTLALFKSCLTDFIVPARRLPNE